MSKQQSVERLTPEYHGINWQSIDLPTEVQRWVPRGNFQLETELQSVSRLATTQNETQNWKWPKRDVCVITDLHADAGCDDQLPGCFWLC